ncbi:MAG TPA: alpha/beta fold hydrolase [Chloroflexota bacterium]|nr:alpha/beta fold hydrolase [Chloroflexota bacterium]
MTFAEMVMNTSAQPHDAWIVGRRPRAPEPRLRLFCLPHAGGGASLFRGWADALPAAVEVCPVQLPGRENRLREPLYTALPPLAAALATALGPWLDRPFALFGHSMGAWIAFALARELRQRYGIAPAQLLVSGRRAPHLPARQPPIHDLPEPRFLTALRDRYNGLPDVILQEPELLEIYLPIVRADMRLVETFTCATDAPLACPIAAFGGTEDRMVSRDELAAWSDHTARQFTLQMFDGGHFFVQTARPALLAAVSSILALAASR